MKKHNHVRSSAHGLIVKAASIMAIGTIFATMFSIAILSIPATRKIILNRLSETAVIAIGSKHFIGFARPFAGALGVGYDIRIIKVLLLCFLLEVIFLGWNRSSLKRITIKPSKSTIRDIILYGLQLVSIMPLFTKVFSLGAVYLTGLFVNAVLSYSTGLIFK